MEHATDEAHHNFIRHRLLPAARRRRVGGDSVGSGRAGDGQERRVAALYTLLAQLVCEQRFQTPLPTHGPCVPESTDRYIPQTTRRHEDGCGAGLPATECRMRSSPTTDVFWLGRFCTLLKSISCSQTTSTSQLHTTTMPLFKSHHNEEHVAEPDSQQTTPPARKGSIFSRHRSQSPSSYHTSSSSYVNGSSRRSTSSDGGSSRRGGGLFSSLTGRSHDYHDDPSIMTARQKVTDAEAAEREADHSLALARASVREAHDQVKILEREAKEEYVLPQCRSSPFQFLTYPAGLFVLKPSRLKPKLLTRQLAGSVDMVEHLFLIPYTFFPLRFRIVVLVLC